MPRLTGGARFSCLITTITGERTVIMDSTSKQMRASIARIGSRIRGRGFVRRGRPALTALLAGGVALTVLSAGGTTALWTGSVTVSPGTVTAGSAYPTLSGFTGIATTFTSSSLSKTSYLQVANTGVTNADYTATFSATGSSALAGSTTVTLWYAASAADCTEAATPYYPVTYAWNAVPQFSGALPAGASGIYCVRTRTAAENLLTSASFTSSMSVTLTVPGSSWSSTASASAVQQVAVDGAAAGSDYFDAVKAGATHYWRLGESSGQVAYDWIGTDDAYAGAGLVRSVTGAIGGDSSTASTFPNDASGTAITRAAVAAPDTFALEAWFKTTSSTGGKIIGFGDSSTGLSYNHDRHIYLDASGRAHFGVWPGTARTLSSAAGLNDGQWHHVVGNLSPAGQEFYVDGVRVGRDTSTTTGWAYTGYWHIGGDTAWDGDSYFDGTIDEVAVYAAPLSASAVQNRWSLSGKGAYPAGVGDPYGRTVYADSPSLFWRLGESGGTTAVDSSPNAHAGTYAGSVTKGVSGAVASTRNTAASFSGTDGLVTSNEVFTNPQSYSIELWFNTTTTTGGKLLGFGNSQTGMSTYYDRHLYLQNDGKVVFGSYPGSTQVVVSPAAYNNGAWHHVVGTQSSSGMALYIDGQLQGTNAAVTPQNYNGYWRVGGDNLDSWPSPPSTPYVTSKIDEVAIYSAALTYDQVKLHYAVPTGVPIASFTSSVWQVAVSFDATASKDYDGSVASYSWNYGDGTAVGTGVTSTHTYAAAGSYTVTLTVTDDSGKTSVRTGKVVATDTTAPSAPGAPTVTGNTGTTVGFSWTAATDNVGVAGYDVYRDGVRIGSVRGTTYTDTGRSINTTYAYQVQAKDAVGNLSPFSGSTSVTTAGFSTTSWYQVQGVGSGKCLTAAGTASPSSLQIYPCGSPAAANQKWQFVATGTGSYQVVSGLGNVVWDVSGASTGDGAEVFVYGPHGGTNQQWTPAPVSGSTYTFSGVGSGKCLDVLNNSNVDGTLMDQYTCNGSTAQQFNLVLAP
ncbi:MAG: hypothetical protein JWR33_1204 [Naasia sp.]|nr:hypothetical protein [Naasia sp.]